MYSAMYLHVYIYIFFRFYDSGVDGGVFMAWPEHFLFDDVLMLLTGNTCTVHSVG